MQWMLRHTRTREKPAPSAQEAHAAALRAAAAVQLGLQLLLWVTFGGYDHAVQAVWQAALVLLLPLLLLFGVWRQAQQGLEKGRWLALLLLPCLWLDAALLLYAICGLVDAIIPEYPYLTGALAAAAVCWLTLVRAREEGVAYGVSALKVPLIVLFLLGTVLLNASRRADRLWPLLGQGVANTAMTALRGTGGLWGTALLFVLPGKNTEKPSLRTAGWAVIPWMAGAVWALWHGFLRPWAIGDALSAGQRLMGLARHASGVWSYQLAGLLWLVAIPASLCANALSGEVLLRRAMPRCPRAVLTLVTLLPGLLAVALLPSRLPSLLSLLMPWRGLISLLAGLLIWFAGRRRRRG